MIHIAPHEFRTAPVNHFSEKGSLSPSLNLMSHLDRKGYEFSKDTLNKVVPVKKFPELIKDCLTVEKKMQSKGLFSCVHAGPAHFTLPMAIEYHFSSSQDFFKKLRNEEQLIRKECKEVKKEVLEGIKNKIADDDQSISAKVVCCSYALLGNFEREESASYFGFAERVNFNRLDNSKEMIQRTLKKLGLPRKEAHHFLNLAEPILNGYANLRLANFLFIGVPYSLLNAVTYDSKAYGMPTGNDLLHFSKNPESFSQLRLIMGKETLSPEFGMEIVLANHKKEVENYCRGTVWMEEEKQFLDSKLEVQPSESEKKEQKKRVELDLKTTDFIQKIQDKLKELFL